MTKQTFLILVRATPYGSHLPRAAIDVALTAAAFEQKVVFVFIDEGVLLLADDQETDQSGLKNIGKMIPALGLYDVETVYVHVQSAQRFNVEDFPQEFQSIDDASLRSLVKDADQVLVF
jgi:tRNA 2-thiouridine synthesizing protein C